MRAITEYIVFYTSVLIGHKWCALSWTHVNSRK